MLRSKPTFSWFCCCFSVTCGNRTPLCCASRWTPHHHCPPAAWRLTEEGTSASTTCSYGQQEKALGSSAAPVMPVGFYFSSSLPAAPKVLLSLASEALPPTLLCSVTGYYPLDVTVTWIREELGGAPAPVSGASFSSLRQSTAGTYSISSFLTAEPGSVGATYTCQVTHVSLEEPLGANTWVAPPGMGVPSFPHHHTWAHGSCPLALFCFPQCWLLLSQGDSLQRSHPVLQDFITPRVLGYQALLRAGDQG